MREIIGGNIRARRIALDLTLAELADRMFGKPKRESYISLVENGKVTIDVVRLADFAHALSCRPSDLLVTVSHESDAA